MRKTLSVALFLIARLAWAQAVSPAPTTPPAPRRASVASGNQGVVVSGKPQATAAGVRILEAGGNAADAGAATLLALSVTYVGAFCVGGEVPIMVYSADKKTLKVLAAQ